jgi:hypothetical protein
VTNDDRGWNGHWLLRALLARGRDFGVACSAGLAFHRFPKLVIDALSRPDRAGFGDGCLWLRCPPRTSGSPAPASTLPNV